MKEMPSIDSLSYKYCYTFKYKSGVEMKYRIKTT